MTSKPISTTEFVSAMMDARDAGKPFVFVLERGSAPADLIDEFVARIAEVNEGIGGHLTIVREELPPAGES